MAAEAIQFTADQNDELKKAKTVSFTSGAAPRGSNLPLSNPFLLIVILLMNNTDVQNQSMLAAYSQQSMLQSSYDSQVQQWNGDVNNESTFINGCPTTPESHSMNTGGLVMTIMGIIAAIAGILAIFTFGISLSLLTVVAFAAIAAGVTSAGLALGGVGGTADHTPGGKDTSGTQTWDGKEVNLKLLDGLVQQDQSKVQQFQNEISQLIQQKISPAQDMQQQNANIIEQMLRLMATSVVQLPV